MTRAIKDRFRNNYLIPTILLYLIFEYLYLRTEFVIAPVNIEQLNRLALIISFLLLLVSLDYSFMRENGKHTFFEKLSNFINNFLSISEQHKTKVIGKISSVLHTITSKKIGYSANLFVFILILNMTFVPLGEIHSYHYDFESTDESLFFPYDRVNYTEGRAQIIAPIVYNNISYHNFAEQINISMTIQTNMNRINLGIKKAGEFPYEKKVLTDIQKVSTNYTYDDHSSIIIQEINNRTNIRVTFYLNTFDYAIEAQNLIFIMEIISFNPENGHYFFVEDIQFVVIIPPFINVRDNH